MNKPLRTRAVDAVGSAAGRWRAGPMLALAAAAFIAAPAVAAGSAAPKAAAPASADAAYQRERAACLKDGSPQSRETCLKEVGAAREEARGARLDNGEDARALSKNAEQRCKNVAVAERDSCLRLAQGEGTLSGSVNGGGVLKELVTTTTAEPAAAPALPAASAASR